MALPSDSVLVKVVADTGLLASVPAALVLATVAPDKLALSVALILLELSQILLSVGPDQMAISVHLVVEPLTLIFLLVTPNVGSLALDLIHLEFSLVD